MDYLLCKKAYRKDGDKRGKIMCKVSNLPCAHAYYCELSMKYKHLDSAKDCPGKEMEDGKTDKTAKVSARRVSNKGGRRRSDH